MPHHSGATYVVPPPQDPRYFGNAPNNPDASEILANALDNLAADVLPRVLQEKSVGNFYNIHTGSSHFRR